MFIVNVFLANVLILYPLKTLENQRSDAFKGYRMETLAKSGLAIKLLKQ